VAVSQKTTVGRLGSIVPRSDSEPAMFVAAGQAGYMTTASGKDAVVAVDALNGTYPTVAEGIEKTCPHGRAAEARRLAWELLRAGLDNAARVTSPLRS
jgi:hypothetical protein